MWVWSVVFRDQGGTHLMLPILESDSTRDRDPAECCLQLQGQTWSHVQHCQWSHACHVTPPVASLPASGQTASGLVQLSPSEPLPFPQYSTVDKSLNKYNRVHPVTGMLQLTPYSDLRHCMCVECVYQGRWITAIPC